MRSPLSSRTNSRSERLTPDDFFDLVASSVVIFETASECFALLAALAAGCAACDGRAMGRQSKYVSELWLIVSILSSLRKGSRRHAAYLPDIAALHCSIELKLQFRAKYN